MVYYFLKSTEAKFDALNQDRLNLTLIYSAKNTENEMEVDLTYQHQIEIPSDEFNKFNNDILGIVSELKTKLKWEEQLLKKLDAGVNNE